MTAFNFRSLLLAAIVLSNCITWTASRHHYAHNVHQHRTRYWSQSAGQYLDLPASYVIPGGEGDGPWGEWGEVSPCSRTCGGGVASQKRICLQPGPEGQSQCSGGDTKYFSCQTQDCPDGSGDFRAEQCAEFSNKAFRGFKYNGVRYTKAPNPCELNCILHGDRFYFRHKLQVIDGTRCNDESFDVCVNGRCQPVGCDMMLNSTAREDKCRECRGNGANCRTFEGIFDSQDLMKGYNDILLIPAGSTSINIEEVEPSNNYLDENVGIRYEYSVPNDSAPPTDKRYNWVHEEFTPCSATCGGGFQTRNVSCRSRELKLVHDSLCDEGLKPPTKQSCSPDPCPPQWVEGPWEECSHRCGCGGVKFREVTCQKIIADGATSIVPDKECFDLLGPKPEAFQKCNEDAPCPTWFVGKWRPCDKLCDEGKQTRSVICYQEINGRIEMLDDTNCTETKPEVVQSGPDLAPSDSPSSPLPTDDLEGSEFIKFDPTDTRGYTDYTDYTEEQGWGTESTLTTDDLEGSWFSTFSSTDTTDSDYTDEESGYGYTSSTVEPYSPYLNLKVTRITSPFATLKIGADLRLTCEVDGFPEPDVHWTRNGAIIQPDGRITITGSTIVSRLTVARVTVADSGLYACHASNPYISQTETTQINVQQSTLTTDDLEGSWFSTFSSTDTTDSDYTDEESGYGYTSSTVEPYSPYLNLKVTRITSPFATLKIGADLRLTCEVDGFPEPDVHWTRNGAIIQPDGRITITGSTIVSRLTVARVTVADSGLYACHASNPYISQTETTQINVQQPVVLPANCIDFFDMCDLVVRSKLCRHNHYSTFCCKSCVEAGQLDPQEAELQADQPLKK